MKQYTKYLIGFFVLGLLAYLSFTYIDYIHKQRSEHQNSTYKREVVAMKKRVSSMILTKQKATISIGLSLANDKSLMNYVASGKIPDDYYADVVDKYKKETLYKNIWIQVLDKNLTSIYRSWTSKKNDNMRVLREDLLTVLKTKNPTYAISSGKYDLSIKAMIPLLREGEVIGIVEVVSHFNSIAKQMKYFNVDSLVLLLKENTKKLEYPFTNIFINGYYVANFDAPKDILDHMKVHGVQRYITDTYIIEDGFLVSTLELKGINKETIAYYIMLKKVDDIKMTSVDFLFFKFIAFGIILGLLVAGVVNIAMIYYIRKQKLYYKNILNSATNIILINNKSETLEVNHAFFKYFKSYKTLKDFKQYYQCICDFFELKGDYLHKEMNGENWVDYLLKNSSKNIIVKMKIESKVYFFQVSASKISGDKAENICSIVFTDITDQENYKRELESISVTDSLTGIGNRRFYQQKIEEELEGIKRHKHSVVLIMCDIDFFKKINDIYGHDKGDIVLQEYTLLIRDRLRTGDIFCRIGGEEFMIILPYTDISKGAFIAEELRALVENFQTDISVTMSFGVVECDKDEDLLSLYSRVDKALYEAKESGRNRVVLG